MSTQFRQKPGPKPGTQYRSKPGPEGKGPRSKFTWRLPTELSEWIDAQVETSGFDNRNDFLCEFVAKAKEAGVSVSALAKPDEQMPSCAA